MQPKIIPVILSGGAGTRLWPVSTPQRPKPFMAMPDGETLLEKTLQRANRLAPDGPVVTVTGKDYLEVTFDEYRRVGCVEDSRLHFVLEPMARNTAPAIAMAMAVIGHQFGPDAVAVVMPSDHIIGDEPAFFRAVETAVELANDGFLVTFGIVPDRPETGYGYIRAGAEAGSGFRVDQFVEKPSLETAQQYVESGEYLWNAGMFCFNQRGFTAALEAVDTKFAADCEECLKQTSVGPMHTLVDSQSFSDLPATSIDYALMEKASDVAVVPADIGWNDVGSWEAIANMLDSDPHGNSAIGEAIFEQSTDCHVDSPRLVALVGVQDLIIVDSGDTLLVLNRHNAQDVKRVVDKIKNR